MRFKIIFLTITALLSFPGLSFTSVRTVKFSPVDASLFAYAGTGGYRTIRLWDRLDSVIVAEFRGHTATVNSVAFSPDGKLLASGSDDYSCKLWDVPNRRLTATLEHIVGRNRSAIKSVDFSPDGQLLATAGWDIKLWNVPNRQEMATLKHDTWVLAVDFSPDGQLLAAGDMSGSVKIWNVGQRQVIAQLEGDATKVHSLTFSPDGRTLATGGYHGFIKLWDMSNWELLGTMENWGTPNGLAFSPDGKALASAAHESVLLWSVESGEKITSFRNFTGWVYPVAFSPDSQVIGFGDDDRAHLRSVATHLQTLQKRDMVRLIYFRPRDRRTQQGINTRLDILIKDTQQFFAEQMQNNGVERKTFTFETGVNGKAVVHHVAGKFADRYYRNDTLDKVLSEINDRFDRSKHVYLIAIDIGDERIDARWCGRGGFEWSGGGEAIIPASGHCFNLRSTAHELGHAFGLQHDFRNNAYIMSYGGVARHELSHCAAKWLNASQFFNDSQVDFNEPTTIRMLPPMSDPPRGVNLRFEVSDADGLHQGQLIIPSTPDDPAEGVKLYGCKSLTGETDTVESLRTAFPGYADYEVTLRTIDVHGNFSQETFSIRADDILTVDVNGDGVVNVTDLVRVAAFFGRTRAHGAALPQDVNRDGVVDVEDILLVIAALEGAADSPAAHPLPVGTNLREWVARAKRHHTQDPTFKKGILFLEQLLTSIRPTATALLPNYPNPFNPETWIPYHLSEPTDVSVSIYSVTGTLVRRLALGRQAAGVYQSKNRAAYWDGRNSSGEYVASGTYFYQLRAGRSGLLVPHRRDNISTRRMVIVK